MKKVKEKKETGQPVENSEALVKVAEKPAQALTATEVRMYFDPQNKCSDTEIGMFIKICQATGLNPFLKEAYLIKYAGSPAQIITGYEAYLKRAERSGLWNGDKCWTEGEGANIKACIEVSRKDWQKPLYHEVYLREYQGSSNPLWKSKPLTMIKKVVTAQAYRRAFPDTIGGLPYTGDEIDREEQPKLPGKPVVAEPVALRPESANVDEGKNAPEASEATTMPEKAKTPKNEDLAPTRASGKLPDFDAQIKAIMKERGLTPLIVRKTLSAEFKRPINGIKDLTILEKETAVKILGGKS